MNNIYKNLIQAKIEKIINSKRANQCVLMFHSISPKERWYDKEYCITPESFENMVLKLKKAGVNFSSIDRIDVRNDKKTVYITFDDVFADVFYYAYPVLKRNNIPFAIFISVNFIDKINMVDRKMLKVLAKDSLCTIGAHTFTHKSLSQCTVGELVKEIYGAKCTLEFLIKKKVNYMAYPYGNIVHVPIMAIVITLLSKYKGAFSTIAAPVYKHMRYFMPRINVNEHNWQYTISKYGK